MFNVDRVKTLVCTAILFGLIAGTAFAQMDPPTASHQANTAAATNGPSVSSFSATITDSEGVSAESTEIFDLVTAGAYRFFGFLSNTFSIGTGAYTASANTRVINLDPEENYLFFFISVSVNAGEAPTSTFSIIDDPDENGQNGTLIYREEYTGSAITTTGTMPTIITGVEELFVEAATIGVEGSELYVLWSMVQIITTTNDCDINGDGAVNNLDIDLLCFAVRSGIFNTVTNTAAIAMFDLNDDGNVNSNDIDILVTDPFCLDTVYGDTDLDGDVDDADLANAFSAFTGPVGEIGGRGWADVDTDCDGDVDDADLATIFNNYTDS